MPGEVGRGALTHSRWEFKSHAFWEERLSLSLLYKLTYLWTSSPAARIDLCPCSEPAGVRFWVQFWPEPRQAKGLWQLALLPGCCSEDRCALQQASHPSCPPAGWRGPLCPPARPSSAGSRQPHWAATVVGPQEGVKSPFVLSQSVGLLAGSKPAFLTSALDYITFD